MLAGDVDPPAIDSVQVTTCSTCGGTMHNKQRFRIANDGFGNAMLVADMDKTISKGHLIVEINSTTTKNPLPCSMDNTTKSLDTKFQVEQNSGHIDEFNEDDNINALKLFAKVPKSFVKWVGSKFPTWKQL
eukprot:8392363-Ditylum_brightwellii.AAC.1